MTTAIISGSDEDYVTPDVWTTYYSVDPYGLFIVNKKQDNLSSFTALDPSGQDEAFAEFLDVIGVNNDMEVVKAVRHSKDQFPNRSVRITITSTVDIQLQNELKEVFNVASAI